MDAIVLKNISKKYNLTNNRPLLVKSLFSKDKQEKWALKNISLNIKKGETVGIIGENGSGKSTLLKIISGITTPTSGSVTINGKVASLIELGAGFHPDLTGKENIYLNATLLGLSKKEIEKKFKEIVDFADIGEYINQPIRTYSSGMVVRLGFSVAIHLDPEILLIDEVFAVGDEEFQRKSIDALYRLKQKRKTILIVSHNLNLVAHFCEKTLLISTHTGIEYGRTFNIIKTYLERTNYEEKIKYKKIRWGDGSAKIIDLLLLKNGNKSAVFTEGERIIIKMKVNFYDFIKNPVFGITIKNVNLQNVFFTNTLLIGKKTGVYKKGETKTIEFSLNKHFLNEGKYYVSPAVASFDLSLFYDWRERYSSFTIKNKTNLLVKGYKVHIY